MMATEAAKRAPSRQSLAAAFLLGLAGVPAFAPLELFPLVFVALGGLYLLLDRAEMYHWRHGALIGGVFGFGFFLGGVSWVYVSLSVFGGMAMPLAALATVLFCAYLALYPALAGALFILLTGRGNFSGADVQTGWQTLRHTLLFAALWTLTEWLRGWLFTGFSWLAVGYSQTPPSPLSGFSPIVGVYGLSWLSAWLGALLAAVCGRVVFQGTATGATRLQILRQSRPIMLTLALTLLCGSLLRLIEWTQPIGQPIRVALLQGNIPQEMKWRPERLHDSLRIYHQLAREHPAQLTVLPETAIPSLLEQVPADYLDALHRLAQREHGMLIFGIPTHDGSNYANSAIALGNGHGNGSLQRYDKVHLVPFGEFVPPGFRWFMDLAEIPMSDFIAGGPQQSPLRLGALKIAPNICYEDAFGEEIARALPEAHLLVNLSNVAWFGDSLAPAQHLQIARLRALETGRVMLRATNTGMTAIVGANGDIAAALPPFTRGALTGEVRAHTGATPYVHGGNLPVIALCLLIIGIVARPRRNNRKT